MRLALPRCFRAFQLSGIRPLKWEIQILKGSSCTLNACTLTADLCSRSLAIWETTLESIRDRGHLHVPSAVKLLRRVEISDDTWRMYISHTEKTTKPAKPASGTHTSSLPILTKTSSQIVNSGRESRQWLILPRRVHVVLKTWSLSEEEAAWTMRGKWMI